MIQEEGYEDRLVLLTLQRVSPIKENLNLTKVVRF
jgi:hypothetical protein